MLGYHYPQRVQAVLAKFSTDLDIPQAEKEMYTLSNHKISKCIYNILFKKEKKKKKKNRRNFSRCISPNCEIKIKFRNRNINFFFFLCSICSGGSEKDSCLGLRRKEQFFIFISKSAYMTLQASINEFA